MIYDGAIGLFSSFRVHSSVQPKRGGKRKGREGSREIGRKEGEEIG